MPLCPCVAVSLLAALTVRSGDHPGSECSWAVEFAHSVHSVLDADGSECLINDDHACVGWGGGEVWVRPFQVLAYSTTNRR